jgi:catechol 2,3-dioxygenase
MANEGWDWGLAPGGYRLPAATKLGPVRLQVAEVARSVAFYEEVLGLPVADRSEHGARLAPRGGATLVELHERNGAAPVPRGGQLGLYHFAILLPARADLGRFVQHLARIGVAAGSADHLVSEAIYLTDPDGLGIEVYADRPRSAWQSRDGQLVMTTDPLDTRSLVAAGQEQPWTGMPVGTTIGHVHLHVGDLERAAAFYHHGVGFDKVVWSYPGALFLSAGGYHHHLGTNTWAATARPAPAEAARLLDWSIVLPEPADVAAAAASMETAGFVALSDGDGVRAADPWGTTVRLLAG